MPKSVMRRVPRLNFAEHFKKARQRNGLSQSEAARQWKIPLRALRNWEQGLRAPNGRALFHLLPVLFPQVADAWLSTFESELPNSRAQKARRRRRRLRPADGS